MAQSPTGLVCLLTHYVPRLENDSRLTAEAPVELAQYLCIYLFFGSDWITNVIFLKHNQGKSRRVQDNWLRSHVYVKGDLVCSMIHPPIWFNSKFDVLKRRITFRTLPLSQITFTMIVRMIIIVQLICYFLFYFLWTTCEKRRLILFIWTIWEETAPLSFLC